MERAEIIANRLVRSDLRGRLQAIALVIGIFVFLPLTRVVTQDRELPVEIASVVRQVQIQSLDQTEPTPQTTHEAASTPDTPSLDPLPLPSPTAIQAVPVGFPSELAQPVPTDADTFEFPLEELPFEPAPTLTALDKSPQLIYQPEVVYPYKMQRQRIAGTVVVKFEINANGRVGAIQIENAPEQEAFEKSVVRALRRGKWRPGERNGRPVRAWVRRTIDFQP